MCPNASLSQVESSRIVAFDAGRGVRFYANYHLDQEGAMSCLVLTPRGASVVRAARQMQRFFTIEQYRLLILARLPGAKSRYPALAKLNDQYESVVGTGDRGSGTGDRGVGIGEWGSGSGDRGYGFKDLM
jgi:uncharacterized membrane-anchored protein